LVLGLFSYIGKINDKVEDMDSKIEIAEQKASEAGSSFTSIKSRVNGNQNQLVELWYASLPKNIIDKFEKWETENEDKIGCGKTFKSATIVSEYYDVDFYNISKARAVVFEFQNGALLYERDGTIHCYALPVTTFAAHDVDCSVICNVKDTTSVGQ